MLRMPVVPEIFGFDPRLQFAHEDDVTGALVYATLTTCPGFSTSPATARIPWSEVCQSVGEAPPPAAADLHRLRPRSRCGCCGSSTSRPRS